MPTIQSRDFGNSTSFGGGNDLCIDSSEWKVTILGHNSSDSQPIAWENRFGDQIAFG